MTILGRMSEILCRKGAEAVQKKLFLFTQRKTITVPCFFVVSGGGGLLFATWFVFVEATIFIPFSFYFKP